MNDPIPVAFSETLASSALVPPPRCFVDLTLPAPEVVRDFEAYLAWLAEHLMEWAGPVPENQAALAREHAGVDPIRAAGALGMVVGYGWDLEASVSSAVSQGLSYEEFIEEMREREGDDEAEQPRPASDFLRREDWERMRLEEEPLRALERYPEQADIPYRPLLAALCQRLPTKEQRVEMLNAFFGEAQDAGSS
jgi:hypothetical protein